MYIKPSEVRFSQDSINNVFHPACLHSSTRIGETLDDLLLGRCNISSIPTISVCHINNVWYTADNRRLWVFQKYEELNAIEKGNVQIYVTQKSWIPEHKMTTTNGGTSVDVRRDAGGTFWKKCQNTRHRQLHQTPRTLSYNTSETSESRGSFTNRQVKNTRKEPTNVKDSSSSLTSSTNVRSTSATSVKNSQVFASKVPLTSVTKYGLEQSANGQRTTQSSRHLTGNYPDHTARTSQQTSVTTYGSANAQRTTQSSRPLTGNNHDHTARTSHQTAMTRYGLEQSANGQHTTQSSRPLPANYPDYTERPSLHTSETDRGRIKLHNKELGTPSGGRDSSKGCCVIL